jgi:spermidine/putrescine transport system substrate-binding protein
MVMNKPLPEDPMMRELVQMARRHQMTRRTALAGAGATAAALALAACAPAGSQGPALTPATDLSDAEKVLIWDNWPDYMDVDDDGNYPTLNRFQEQSGIKVEYKIRIDDNNSYWAVIKDQLQLGADIGADVACPTEWLVARMVALGYLQDLDAANIPNKKNINPAYLGASFDPDRIKSMPFQGIFAGIGYNKKAYKEATGKEAPESLDDLWADTLKGRVVVLSEMRDTLGLILLANGVDITSSSSLNEDAFMTAVDFFRAKVSDGNISIKGNSYSQDLASGAAIAGITWQGDIAILNAEKGTDADPEPYGFILPSSGATISADTFVVPMGATHKKNVEKLIDFYYEPANAAELAAWVNYITPVLGAQEEAAKLDASLAENQLIFPNEKTLSNAFAFRALSGAEELSFAQAFEKVLLGS